MTRALPICPSCAGPMIDPEHHQCPAALVTDFTGATHRAMTLSPEHRKLIETRLMVQTPSSDPTILRATKRKIEGLGQDQLMALEALDLLAEQGNEVAKFLLVQERKNLGIDRRHYSFPSH